MLEKNLVFALGDGAAVPWHGCTTGHKTLKYFEENSSPCMCCTVSRSVWFCFGESRKQRQSWKLKLCSELLPATNKGQAKNDKNKLYQCCCIFAAPLHSKKKPSLYKSINYRKSGQWFPKIVSSSLTEYNFSSSFQIFPGLHQCFSIIRGKMYF